MRRNAKERAVITTGVKAANVEVPMILRNDQHVRLDQFAFTSRKLFHQSLILAQTRIVGRKTFDIVSGKLFVKTDESVRIVCFMERSEPFGVGVPLAQPRRTVSYRNNEVWIFEDLQG